MKIGHWCLLLLWSLLLGAWGFSAGAMGQPSPPPTLSMLREAVNSQLVKLDADLNQTARQIAATGLNSPETDQLLSQLYNEDTSIVDCVTVDINGRIVLIQPDRYKYSQGSDISQQPHVIQLLQTRKPVLSSLFKTVEGFSAVVLTCPVFSDYGDLLGSVSIVFKPDALIGNAVRPLIGNYSLEVTALQTDGYVLYDRNLRQIGLTTFSDPLFQPYPGLLALASRITAETTGTGSYEFTAKSVKGPVTKAAEWTTVGLYGTEWRLMMARTGTL